MYLQGANHFLDYWSTQKTATKGATAFCNWYSVIETAKANNLDAYTYLTHILTQLPIDEAQGKDIDGLLPWNVEVS